MTNGEANGTQFAARPELALEFLSSTTGLPTWALVRHDMSGNYAHSPPPTRPAGSPPDTHVAPVESTPSSRVAIDIHLADGALFGTVVGYGSRQTPEVIVEISGTSPSSPTCSAPSHRASSS